MVRPCQVCGATRFRRTHEGQLVCTQGHVYFDYREELLDQEAGEFSSGPRHRRRVAVRERSVQPFDGVSVVSIDVVREHYLLAMQCVLQMECDDILKAIGIKAMTEKLQSTLFNLFMSYLAGMKFITLPSYRKLAFTKPKLLHLTVIAYIAILNAFPQAPLTLSILTQMVSNRRVRFSGMLHSLPDVHRQRIVQHSMHPQQEKDIRLTMTFFLPRRFMASLYRLYHRIYLPLREHFLFHQLLDLPKTTALAMSRFSSLLFYHSSALHLPSSITHVTMLLYHLLPVPLLPHEVMEDSELNAVQENPTIPDECSQEEFCRRLLPRSLPHDCILMAFLSLSFLVAQPSFLANFVRQSRYSPSDFQVPLENDDLTPLLQDPSLLSQYLSMCTAAMNSADDPHDDPKGDHRSLRTKMTPAQRRRLADFKSMATVFTSLAETSTEKESESIAFQQPQQPTSSQTPTWVAKKLNWQHLRRLFSREPFINMQSGEYRRLLSILADYAHITTESLEKITTRLLKAYTTKYSVTK